MLNTPTSVDSLPRLRRFTSSQTQLCSFAYLGHDEGPVGSKSQEDKEEVMEPKDEEEEEAGGTADYPSREAIKHKGNERKEERKQEEQVQRKQSEVLCQPVSERRSQGTGAISVKAETQEKRDLVEVSLSDVKAPGGPAGGREVVAEMEVEGDAGGDGDDQKMCCGFFFKVTVALIVHRKNQIITYLTLSFCTDLVLHWAFHLCYTRMM